MEKVDLTKQTLTVGAENNPMMTLMEGHVDSETFNKAHKAEGWEFDDYAQEDLEHTYGYERKDKGWDIDRERWSTVSKPITIHIW